MVLRPDHALETQLRWDALRPLRAQLFRAGYPTWGASQTWETAKPYFGGVIDDLRKVPQAVGRVQGSEALSRCVHSLIQWERPRLTSSDVHLSGVRQYANTVHEAYPAHMCSRGFWLMNT